MMQSIALRVMNLWPVGSNVVTDDRIENSYLSWSKMNTVTDKLSIHSWNHRLESRDKSYHLIKIPCMRESDSDN